MSKETWRDAPRCDLHDDYDEDCAMCFAEAVEGGMMWLIDQALPGTRAIEMPSTPAEAHHELPFYRAFEVWFETDRLFAVTYRRGDGLVVPENADDRLRELLAAARSSVEFWDFRVESAQRKRASNTLLHRAMKRRGEAGAYLNKIEGWRIPLIEGDRES